MKLKFGGKLVKLVIYNFVRESRVWFGLEMLFLATGSEDSVFEAVE